MPHVAVVDLFHGRTDLARFNLSELATYHGVNEKFAKQLVAASENHDLIWVQDYHFLFLGEELRRRGIKLPTGFFLHIPFSGSGHAGDAAVPS